MPTYPYYIVTWRTGRLPCPPQYAQISSIRRQFESGRIGGTRVHEDRCDTTAEAKRVAYEHRQQSVSVYVVDAPGRPRRFVHWQRLQSLTDSHEVRDGEA